MTLRGYVGQLLEVRPVLAAMEDRGLPIDDTARLRLDAEFDLAQRELHAELIARAPAACCRVQPKTGYVGIPPEVKKVMSAGAGLYDLTLRFYDQTPKEKESGEDGEYYRYECRQFSVAVVDPVTGAPVATPTLRWCRVYDFNPNSSQQLIDYMRAKKHTIPKGKQEDDDGNTKDTTAKKELVRLAKKTGDTFYLKVIDYRELSKMRGTYINGFVPAADGCVHTTFTFDTGTGQLTCCASWTPILTKRGSIPISEVRIGDAVWTHRERWRRVSATWTHSSQLMVAVHLSNGEVLTCTAGHRVLLSVDECIEEMDNYSEYISSSGSLSKFGIPHPTNSGRPNEYNDSEHLLGRQAQDAACRASGVGETSLLQIEDGKEESSVREAGGRDSKLGGRGRRWVRISDLLGRWKESVRSSTCSGKGIGSENPSKDIRRTSYRRRSKEQSIGQSGSRYESGACGYTLTSARGLEGITIEKIVPVGSLQVYDITVEEDESYESCGVFSHNSRNPNIQNFPKHGRLAKAIRSMIAAPPGHLIAEADFKSYHALTTGYCAESPAYMRLARLDIHSFVAGCALGCWEPSIIAESDESLMERFRWLKSDPAKKVVRDRQAKTTSLGMQFGMGYRRLYQENLEHFDSEKSAKRMWELIRAVFPEVYVVWQQKIRQLAHEQKFLRSPFGHIRRFYEVFRWDALRGDWAPGDQAEEAVAFLPANIAFGNIRECLKEQARLRLDARYGLMDNIHDSFVYMFPESQLESFVAEVIPVLRAPSKVLVHPVLAPAGLIVDVELAVGPRLSEMREVKLAPATLSTISSLSSLSA